MTETSSEFVVRDSDDGVIVVDANEVEVAKFMGDYAYNPAFLAFVEGMRSAPGISIWMESQAQYLLEGGQIRDERITSAIEAVKALSAVAMKVS